MAGLLSSLADFITQNPRGGPLLPSNAHDVAYLEAQAQAHAGEQGMLGSDYLGAQYVEGQPFLYEGDDDIELEPVITEEELALQAYSYAKHNTHRAEVYESDFYRHLNARCPDDEAREHVELVWRVDVDHPLVIVLLDVVHAEPVHVIRDVYGNQAIFDDHSVRVAVGHLLDLCEKYALRVSPTPKEENLADEGAPNTQEEQKEQTREEQSEGTEDVTITLDV